MVERPPNCPTCGAPDGYAAAGPCNNRYHRDGIVTAEVRKQQARPRRTFANTDKPLPRNLRERPIQLPPMENIKGDRPAPLYD